MSAPSVYAAINAISAELAQHGIAKSHVNEADDYRYRSIDDLLDRLAPLLAKHRLCVLPRVKKRTIAERQDEGQRLLFHVSLKVAFTLTSVDDGPSHVVEAYGEALDASDKATAKAMSAAYKSAMIQTFCIPLAGSEDPDRASPRATSRTHVPEPVQGWEQWARDIEDIVGVCESDSAIELVQERNRGLLKALSRERQELYQHLGEAFRRAAEGARRAGRATVEGKAPEAQRRAVCSRRAGDRKCLSCAFPLACRQSNARKHRGPAPLIAPGSVATTALYQAASGLLVECAHVRGGHGWGSGPQALGPWTISLCRDHHLEQHELGEPAFEARYELNLRHLAKEFAQRSPYLGKLRTM